MTTSDPLSSLIDSLPAKSAPPDDLGDLLDSLPAAKQQAPVPSIFGSKPTLQTPKTPTVSHSFHGEPVEVPEDRTGEPGMSEAMGFGQGGYGAYIPHTTTNASWSDQVNNGAIRFLSGIVSPKAAAETLGFMTAGEALPALSNLPKVATYLKDFPTVLKALDITSKAAIPAATGGLGLANLYQQGRPKNVEDAVVAAGNALVAGLGIYGAIKAGKATLANYPQPPTGTSINVPGTSETIAPEQIGGVPTVKPATAEARAQALESQGQNLAAQAWKNVNVKTPTEIPTDLGKVYLQPADVTTKRPYYSVRNAHGETVVGGTATTVRNWLNTHTSRVSGGLRGEATSATVVGGAESPLSTEISTPQFQSPQASAAASPLDSLVDSLPTVEAPQITGDDLKPGAEFTTSVGSAKVLAVKGNLVKYADKAGNENVLPVKRFLSMVAPAPQTPSVGATTSAPQNQQPTAQTPAETAPIDATPSPLDELVDNLPAHAAPPEPISAQGERNKLHIQALAEASGVPEETAQQVLAQAGAQHPGVESVAPQETESGTSNPPNPLPGGVVSAGAPGAEPVSVIPEGNGPGAVRGLPGESNGQPGAGKPEPPAGSQGESVRRVTGSADEPLIPAGVEQAEEMAETKATKPFNIVRYAPNSRSSETAGKFFAPENKQDRTEMESADGWPRGQYEGQEADDVKDQMADLILNADKVPPGVSPLSGDPGKSWNQMAKPLFADVQKLQEYLGPEDRALVVTSGGNMQAIDAWGKAGYPADYEFDRSEMAAQPYWSVTGKMFVLADGGLKEVPNNEAPGRVYIVEHGATKFNPPSQERNVAPETEPRTVDQAADQIFAAMKKSEQEPGTSVTFKRLRRETPELASIPKAVFDKAAMKLQADRRALLMVHDHAMALEPGEREHLVDGGDGQYYVSIYDRGAALAKKPVTPQVPTGVAGATSLGAKPTTIEAAPNEPVPAEAEQPFGGLDRQPLEEQLPGGGTGVTGPESTPAVSRAGGRKRRGSQRTSPEQGPELESGTGTVSGVVGDPAEPEVTFPPRGTNPTSTSHDGDYRIPNGRTVSGSPERRARVNIDAITKLREIESESRPATVEEQNILASYVGWGAVPQLFAGSTPEFQKLQGELKNLVSEQEYTEAQRSTTNAHYTGDNVVDAMWRAMLHLGAKPGMSWLEPAIGTGNFFGRQPDSLLDGARRMGIEKDALTGAIARLLYPDSGVDIMPFERAELPEGYFDGAISNVPFGNFGVHDPAMKKFLTSSIHNYFFAKALTLVRPGGVVGFVTSRYTLDAYAPAATEFRKWMAERADFIGAVRLPSGAFRQNAGTDVITDIIFLRRRIPGQEGEANRAGASWVESRPKQISTDYYGKVGIPVNEYFHKHPEMILGAERTARGQFTANDYDVHGTLTDERLNEAIQSLEPNWFKDYAPSKATRTRAIRELNAPAEESKLGGLFFDDKGILYRKTSKGSAEPVEMSGQNRVRIKGQLLIRNELVKLMDAERNPEATDSDISKARKRLNAAYDHYVKDNGFLSARSNTSVMAGDPDAPLLVSLERRYNQGNKAQGKKSTAEKAPILSRRMFQPEKPVTSVSDPKDALYVSLNETGRIDWDRMSALSGKAPEQLQKDLAGLVYRDPRTNTWQTADEYLSGSVRKKLKEARAISKLEPGKWDDNVTALEGAQPEDIPPGEIRAALGITWVPIDTYGEFVQDILGLDRPGKVMYIAGNWHVEIPYNARGRSASAEKWNTAKVGALELIKDSLNMRRTKVYDSTSDGPELNVAETRAAQNKQDELQKYFNDWLFAEPARADEMTRLYNELNNDLRLWQADGAHLTLPGMVRDSAVLRTGDLEPHQKNAVWRVIKQKNVLLAHAVGTGKTFEAIAAGMELKRLGLVRRPMYVVPNDTLGGWQLQFNALYPQARTLVFSEKDLEKSKRQRVMAQIATGDWDAVVMPHSSFQFLGTGDEIFQQHFDKLSQELTEQITEASAAGLDTRQIKRMEKAKERLLKSLEDKRKEEKKDQTVTWEQLGIDQLFVDESHEYKKLGFATKQGNVAGIDQNGNQKTFDLLMKLRYTQTHGRGAVFLTGTPITNTMGEMFNLMKYLIEPEIEARGIAKFDEWSANYGRTVPVFEPKPEGGGYQMKARYAKFVNLPELIQLFRSFADVVTADMVKLPVPEIIGGTRRAVITVMTPEQEEYLSQDLQPRAASIRRDPRNSLPDNMLSVYTDAGKMAMDIRMVSPGSPSDPDGRLMVAAAEIYKLWKESTPTRGAQAVFADVGKPASAGGSQDFSFYEHLIDRLVDLGIPKNEISTIYEAKNKTQRRQLFEKFNDGKIRVMLGSTKKMGQGVNIQERLYALHHLDIPARPDQLEQREGRILRQGNTNPAVHILYYMTKGTLDEKKFADVVRKGKFVSSAMQGKTTVREAEDIGGMIPSLEMFQAMTSGDPRVLRKMEVDAELDRLSSVRAGWKNQLWKARGELSVIPGIIRREQGQIERLKAAIRKRDATGRVFTVAGKRFEGEGISEEVANRFYAAADKLRPLEERLTALFVNGVQQKEMDRAPLAEPVQIGTAYGLPVILRSGFGPGYQIGEDDVANAQIGEPEDKKGTFARIQNAVTGLDGKILVPERVIETQTKNQTEYRKFVETPWPYEADYEKLVNEQAELVKALGGDKGDDAAIAAEPGTEIKDKNVEAEEQSPEEEDAAADNGESDSLGPEAGQAPALTDLNTYFAQRLGIIPKDQDEVYENYSGLTGAANVGLGAEESKFVRNLGQTSRASAPVEKAAIRTASSKAQSAAVMRASVPLMKKALEGSEFTLPEVRLAMVESRLRGIRERWRNFADQAIQLADEEIPEAFDSHLLNLLNNIAGRKDIPQDVAQTATALFNAKDYETLREFLADTFFDASERVGTVMDDDWFNEATADPHVQDAVRIYKSTVEAPMAENHAINEGVFSNALGPLDTYYPLIPIQEEGKENARPGPGKRRPYHAPRNLYNAFATGLSERGYDISPQAFRDRLAGAFRANNKAALIHTLEDVGLVRNLGRKEPAPLFFKWKDQHFTPATMEVGKARTLYKDGKVIHVPAQMAVMPMWLRRELLPILEEQVEPAPSIFQKFAALANTGSTKGPADFVFHMTNLLGTLIANTPFLENSAGGKAMSLPVIKKFYAIAKLASIDPLTEASAEKLIRMAKMGLIPSRYASETFSKKLAEELGAERAKFSLTPLLYGPKGFDIRARLLMYDLANEINPDAPDSEIRATVNQLGNYVSELQGEIERAVKSSMFGPFFTAGSQMLRNGVNAFLGTSPLITPGGHGKPPSEIAGETPDKADMEFGKDGQWKATSAKARLRGWMLLQSGLFMAALWAFLHKQLAGKWPWEDTRAKLFMFPSSAGGSAWLDQFRHSKLGNELWGPGNESGYLNFGYFDPIVARGARALGLQQAFNERAAHGTPGQQFEAAGTGIAQALAQPFMGPIPRAAFVGITGAQPYAFSIRNREGKLGQPQLMPAIPPSTRPGWPSTAKRAIAAVSQLNALATNIGEDTGFLSEDPGKKGNQYFRMLLDFFPLTTGAVANASNPYAHETALRRQRAGESHFSQPQSAKPSSEDAGKGYGASKLAPEPEPTAQSRWTRTPISFGQTYNAPDENSASTLYNEKENHAESIEANFGSDQVANNRMLRHESIHGMLVEGKANYQKVASDPAVKAAAAPIKKIFDSRGYRGDIDRELPAYLGSFSNAKGEWTEGVTAAQRERYVNAYIAALVKNGDPQTAAKYKRMLIDSSSGTPASAVDLYPATVLAGAH